MDKVDIKNLLLVQFTSCGNSVGISVTSDFLTEKEKRDLISIIVFNFNNFVDNAPKINL